MMKRSPSPCSSSSSSSCIESLGTSPPKPKSKSRSKCSKRAKRIVDLGSQSNVINPDTPSSARRSSIYRGVTRHRWTGRFEAHLWDKTTWNSIQNKKGRQIYLGAYDNEEAAARTYDLAALKYWGPTTILNFPIETYTKEIEEMEKLSKDEYLASLRRRSSGFSRGVSKYRGVARHHHNGRWEARIGRVFGNKYLYLGTYGTQEEAAAAYDMAAIEYRGPNAVTNFDISIYADKLNADKLKSFHQKIQQKGPRSPEEVQVNKQTENLQHPEGNMAMEDSAKASLEEAPRDESQPMVVLDPCEEHEHPWNLCLETGFNSLPISDIPFDKPSELPDLFGDSGFEDDIEFIFDGLVEGNEFNMEGSSGSTLCGMQIESSQKEQETTNSPSSPVSSTSVCSKA